MIGSSEEETGRPGLGRQNMRQRKVATCKENLCHDPIRSAALLFTHNSFS